MSVRYRKIEPRMWTDGAFRGLSAAGPNGQTLWLFLLTGPFTVSIPGCVVASDVAIAAALGWNMEGFRKAFLEVEEKGLAKADWKAGLIVLEKALIESGGSARDTNKPGNPNVLKSWANVYDELPDCELKSLVLSRIESLSESLSKAFGKAFQEAFRKALAKDGRKPSAKPSGKAFVQEQDQEQDQELVGSEPTKQPDGFSLTLPQASCPRPERAGRKTTLPVDFAPGPVHSAFAAANHLDLAAEVAAWRDHHTAHRSLFADWSAALSTWLRKSVAFRDERRGRAHGGQIPPAPRPTPTQRLKTL